MKITRHVPLDSALRAAGDVMDYTQKPRDEENAAFSEWINAPRNDLDGAVRWRSTDSLLDVISVPAHLARALADEVPDTPAGNSWRDAVRESIALTEADIDRPFDEVAYDSDDADRADLALADLCDTLSETSPLLEPVVDSLTMQAMSSRSTLGDVIERRARLTAEGLIVGHKSERDKHEEDCYGDEQAVALWRHIDVIAPGTEARIRDLLARMDAGFPDVGVDDSGAARRPARYRN